MITGLIANALGWDRADDEAHNLLQARVRMGTRIEAQGSLLTDFQTAQLGARDRGWTTWGAPEVRNSSPESLDGPHLRYRDYHADLTALVAMRLEPIDGAPTLDNVATALDRPKRPLFIGRKPCLPTARLFAGWCEADTVLEALEQVPFPAGSESPKAQWPDGEGQLAGDRMLDLCDERNWTTGVHGGWRPVREGVLKARRGNDE